MFCAIVNICCPIQGARRTTHVNTAKILGMKISVCSWMEVAVWRIPIISPTVIATKRMGRETDNMVQIALLNTSKRLTVVTGIPYPPN